MVSLPRFTALGALTSGIVIFTMVGPLVRPAQAQTQALDFAGGNNGTGSGSAASTVGWSFTLSSAVTVTQLGVFDKDNDGFINSHGVGLWDSSGTLLASTTLGSGLSGTPVISGGGSGAFRYVGISPVVITPGTYVLGAAYGNSDADNSYFSASSTTMAPGFTFLTERGSGSASLSFPTSSFVNNGLFGPNLRFGPAATPEPGTLALFASGALLFAASRIRRRPHRP